MIYALILSFFVVVTPGGQTVPEANLIAVFESKEMCEAVREELFPEAKKAPEYVTKFGLACVGLKTESLPNGKGEV